MNLFEREEILIGKENLEKLKNTHIAVFGVGGVGSFVVEAFVRAGVGKLTLVDFDIVEESNVNRQIQATIKTIGHVKVDEIAKRALDINPQIEIKCFNEKYNQETKDEIFNSQWDYIVDAIDMVSSKLVLIEQAKEFGIPIISSMGTGNKIYPSKFEIADVHQTSMCPLARVMRKELRKRGIKDVKVLYSKEKPKNAMDDLKLKGTLSFVPSSAGLLIAGEVIRELLKLGELYGN